MRMQSPGIRRYVLHSLGATLLVTATPLTAVWWLETIGRIRMGIPSFLLGMALSAGVAALGSWLWMRHPGSRDVVFADLMLWGLIRRLRTERFLDNMRVLLDRSQNFCLGSTVDAERQIEILLKLSAALEVADPYTHGHAGRVARHAEMIAKALRLPAEEVELIRLAGAVHDVGKVYVPREALTKPGKLTAGEYDAMKEHASKGSDLVSEVGNPALTAIVRHHHERLDGRGYPDGLAGDAIPLGARVIAVADTFDAVTSTRSYRAAAKHKDAIEILRKESGTQLDAAAVEAFLAYYSGRTSMAWWVNLTTAPQRLLGHLLSLLREAGANTAVAAGTAALLTATVVASGDLDWRRGLLNAQPKMQGQGDLLAQHVNISSDTGPGRGSTIARDGSGDGTGGRHSGAGTHRSEGEGNAAGPDGDASGRGVDGPDDRGESPTDEGSGAPGASPGGSGGSTVKDVGDTASDAVADVVGGAEGTVGELADAVDGSVAELEDKVAGAGGLVDGAVSLLSR